MSDLSYIKQLHRNMIRGCMLEKRCFTKKELGILTGLSFPTVNKIVDEQLECGEVKEEGLQASTGGRRAKAYYLNAEYTYTLGMYLTNDAIIYDIRNVFGEEVEKRKVPIQRIAYIQAFDEILEGLIKRYPMIKSIGVGIPGSVKEGQIMYIDCYSELQGFPMKSYLEEKWGRKVVVENDMKAIVQGCYEKLGKGQRYLAAIYLGHNGPGCGMIVNGEVVRGAREFAGEVGFLPMYNDSNLQEIALKGLSAENIHDYLARLITAITSVINPSKIIIYNHSLIANVECLEGWCQKYLPPEEVPHILLSEEYDDHYMQGLHQLVYRLIYPSITL